MALSPRLAALLARSPAPGEQEAAWSAFLDEYSRLILHIARSFGGDGDAVMDRYAFVVAALHADDHRRLRQYAADPRCTFTTWLVVVVRRLCLDEQRARYGRPTDATSGTWERRVRRELVDLVGSQIDLNALAGSDLPQDLAVQAGEVRSALDAALSDLETRDRLILRMRFEDELSVPEIARVLGIGSPFVVYRRIDALLRTLREALLRAGIEDPFP